MRNFIKPGETVTLTAPSGGVVGGSPVLVGAIFCVPAGDADQGDPFEGMIEGQFELAKTSAQAWAEGDRIYWSAGTSKVSNVSSDGVQVGVAVAAAANPSSTGMVVLVPGGDVSAGSGEAAIADVATADADSTYDSAEATLINEIKTKLNTLLAELRTAGIILP